MTSEPPNEGDRDYEPDFVLHPPMEFDMAADLGLPPLPLRDDDTLDTVLHSEMVFDGMPSEWIDCTYQYDAANPPANPAQEVAAVASALAHYDRSLGGHGLALDVPHSSAVNGTIVLVLRPLRLQDAAERLRTMAQALGGRFENGLPPKPPSSGRLPEAIARPVQQGVAQPQHSDQLPERIRRLGIALRFHTSIE